MVHLYKANKIERKEGLFEFIEKTIKMVFKLII